jgi:pimeloyl-ACP methyl ester carboxylesterase
MVVDDSRPPVGDDYVARLEALIAAGRRGKAIKLFMREGVRVPAFFTLVMPLLPMWSPLKKVAHTVVYDTRFVEEHLHGRPLPAGRWSSVRMPTLVLAGGKSPAWLQNAMQELADALPHAELRTLPGQTHLLEPKATAPVLLDFLGTPDPAAVSPSGALGAVA